jgi:hypothetical protein
VSEGVSLLVRGLVLFSPCELVVEARGQFGNPDGEHPPLEAVIRQRLVKTKQAEKT